MAVKSGKFQFVGDKAPIKYTPPVSSPSSDPKSGQFQLVGSEAPLRRTPTVQSPSSNPKSGQFQLIGSEAPNNRAPVKGYGSAYNLTMSERAVQQSNTAAGKGGRSKKSK